MLTPTVSSKHDLALTRRLIAARVSDRSERIPAASTPNWQSFLIKVGSKASGCLSLSEREPAPTQLRRAEHVRRPFRAGGHSAYPMATAARFESGIAICVACDLDPTELVDGLTYFRQCR